MSPEFSVPTLMYGIETPFRFGWWQLFHYAVGASERGPFLRWVALEQLSSRTRECAMRKSGDCRGGCVAAGPARRVSPVLLTQPIAGGGSGPKQRNAENKKPILC